jgi:hypothetical protein
MIHSWEGGGGGEQVAFSTFQSTLLLLSKKDIASLSLVRTGSSRRHLRLFRLCGRLVKMIRSVRTESERRPTLLWTMEGHRKNIRNVYGARGGSCIVFHHHDMMEPPLMSLSLGEPGNQAPTSPSRSWHLSVLHVTSQCVIYDISVHYVWAGRVAWKVRKGHCFYDELWKVTKRTDEMSILLLEEAACVPTPRHDGVGEWNWEL